MPTKNNNIIKYNQGEKSIKTPFTIYADLECLLEKMSTCINNPNESVKNLPGLLRGITSTHQV